MRRDVALPLRRWCYFPSIRINLTTWRTGPNPISHFFSLFSSLFYSLSILTPLVLLFGPLAPLRSINCYLYVLAWRCDRSFFPLSVFPSSCFFNCSRVFTGVWSCSCKGVLLPSWVHPLQIKTCFCVSGSGCAWHDYHFFFRKNKKKEILVIDIFSAWWSKSWRSGLCSDPISQHRSTSYNLCHRPEANSQSAKHLHAVTHAIYCAIEDEKTQGQGLLYFDNFQSAFHEHI